MKRPPKDITLERFFTDWLPSELGGQTAPAPLHARVVVVGDGDGEGGGVWDLHVGPDGLRVTAPNGAEPPVTVKLGVSDWRGVVLGDGPAGTLAPPDASPNGLMLLDATARDLVKTAKGIVRFEVADVGFAATLKLGTGPMGPPDATVVTDAHTYAALPPRRVPLAQAYFQGRIRLTGDVNLAMQLGMALMTTQRFG